LAVCVGYASPQLQLAAGDHRQILHLPAAVFRKLTTPTVPKTVTGKFPPLRTAFKTTGRSVRRWRRGARH
jgi:hypothetical protein